MTRIARHLGDYLLSVQAIYSYSELDFMPGLTTIHKHVYLYKTVNVAWLKWWVVVLSSFITSIRLAQ